MLPLLALLPFFASYVAAAPPVPTFQYLLHNNCPTDIELHVGSTAAGTTVIHKGATLTQTGGPALGPFWTTTHGGQAGTATKTGFHLQDGYYYIVRSTNPALFNVGIKIAPHTNTPVRGFCEPAICDDETCPDAFAVTPTTFPPPNPGAPQKPLLRCFDTAYDVTFCPNGVWPNQPVPTAKFEIHPGTTHPDKCLDVRGNLQQAGTPVQIYDCNGTPAQAWNIIHGTTKIQLAGTTYCLDAGATPANGVGMKIQQCANLPAQLFAYTAENQISVSGKGQCLDVKDGVMTNGAQLQTWQCAPGNANQIWTLSAVRPPNPPATKARIHPNGNNAKCLDVRAAVFANGTPVQIYDCNGTPAQDFILKKGTTKVQLAGTNYCLDAGSAPANGIGMKIWQCYDGLAAQQFIYTADNHISLESKAQCLDLTDGKLTNGNKVQTWQCAAGNTNQLWTVTTA